MKTISALSVIGTVLFTAAFSYALDNIALGKPYTLEPAPNYPHCTDPEDGKQLTDGVYTDGYFWTQASTVGWTNGSPVIITIDLGAVMPIRGVSFNTAAGVAGVEWPDSIQILLADEDRLFHEAGDLRRLDAVHGQLPRDTYAVHRFWTDSLQMHGRYVAIIVAMTPFTFVDEIEVYPGIPDWTATPFPDAGVADIKSYLDTLRVRDGVLDRMRNDLQAIRDLLTDSLDVSVLNEISTALDRRAREVENMPMIIREDFRAVLPLNALHARILAIQARVWRASGCPPVTVWQSESAWDFLPHIGVPPQNTQPRIEMHMMQGEYRAAAFQVSNAGDRDILFDLRVEGLPGNGTVPCVTVHEVAWTDTRDLRPVAAALPEVLPTESGYPINAPCGLTRQVWLTFHPTEVPAGHYEGQITLNSPNGIQAVPVSLHVYPMRFPEKPTLHCGGWDYVNSGGTYGITPQNRFPFIQHLLEHFVNAPWATNAVIPAATFTDGVYAPGDTAAFDEWVALWPDASRYYIFAAVSDRIGPFKIGDPGFGPAVQEWVKFLASHAAEKGVAPEKLFLLLVDEPSENAQDAVILAWANAIRAANTGVQIWEDPIYTEMEKANLEMISACHVLCPNRQIFLNKGKPYQDYFAARQQEGRRLEFYSCSGPARLLDPYSYYRLQPWLCWQWNGSASHFWAFGDNGGYSTWNEYLGPRAAFTPIFIEETSVTAAKEMEAIREGIEDYEYLVMLRKAVADADARGMSGDASDKAKALLDNAAKRVLDDAGSSIMWLSERKRTLADDVRLEILEALSVL